MPRDYIHVYYLFSQHMKYREKSMEDNKSSSMSDMLYALGVFPPGNNMVGSVWGWGRQETRQCSAVTAAMLARPCHPAEGCSRRKSWVEGTWALLRPAQGHMWVRVKCSCWVWAISVTSFSRAKLPMPSSHYVTFLTLSKSRPLTPALRSSPSQ